MISIDINNNKPTEEQENENENEKLRLTGKEGPKYNIDLENKQKQNFFIFPIFFLVLFIFCVIFIATFIILKIINGKKDNTNREIQKKERLNVISQQNNIIQDIKISTHKNTEGLLINNNTQGNTVVNKIINTENKYIKNITNNN